MQHHRYLRGTNDRWRKSTSSPSLRVNCPVNVSTLSTTWLLSSLSLLWEMFLLTVCTQQGSSTVNLQRCTNKPNPKPLQLRKWPRVTSQNWRNTVASISSQTTLSELSPWLRLITTYHRMKTSSTRTVRSSSSQAPVTTSISSALQTTSELMRRVSYGG